MGHDYGQLTRTGGREPHCEITAGERKRSNIHVRESIDEAGFVATREARDATLGCRLILALHVNLRAGTLEVEATACAT